MFIKIMTHLYLIMIRFKNNIVKSYLFFMGGYIILGELERVTFLVGREDLFYFLLAANEFLFTDVLECCSL